MKSDPLALFTWMAAALVGNTFSQIVAPYMLIMAMTTVGALASLGWRDPAAKPNGFLYVLIVNGFGIGLTSLIASLTAANFSSLEERALFAPVALAIGLIGLDYPKLIPKAWSMWVEWRRGGKSEGDKNGT